MPEETGPLAILFADIAKSTQLYELLGDEEAQSLIASCVTLLSKAALQHRGTIIKTIGDEILCTFVDANDAVAAAKLMHRAVGKLPPINKPGFGSINLYIGIHMGHVIEDGGDIFGDAVNIAARLVELSKQRQILITEQVVEALYPENRGGIQSLYETIVKGKSGPISVYECIWEEEALTIIEKSPLSALTSTVSLELHFHEQLFVITQTRPTFTLGRQGYNDLVVEDYCVSRSHARIDLRRGQFVLTDQSTNGTYLVIQGEEPVHITRDLTQLHGSGIISLGRELDSDAPDLIYFTVKS